MQGYDEDISVLFVRGFNGKMAKVGYIIFSITKETIGVATKLPREGTHSHKHFLLLWKLNPGVRTIALTKIANQTCKLHTKET